MFYYEAAADKYKLVRGSDYAAGFDLVACIDGDYFDAKAAGYESGQEHWSFITILPGERKRIDTGVRIAIGHDCYGRVAPRSGLAVRDGIDVLAGVIDSDYRGRVVVVLINHGKERFVVKDGDRIAQLVIEKIYDGNASRVANINDFGSARGDAGFGSTGVNEQLPGPSAPLQYHTSGGVVVEKFHTGRVSAPGRDKEPV